MTIYLATGNTHKQKEFSEIFSQHKIVIPSDLGITFNPVEKGTTFLENSLIKAKELWEIVKKPVLADDSGICVDILSGRPGIYSARYAGASDPRGEKSNGKFSSSERNKLLLTEAYSEQLKQNISDEIPLACHFVCAMVFYYGYDKFYSVQETIEGQLIKKGFTEFGDNGFGYDPIVYIPEYGKTIASLTDEEKNAISHRGKAAIALKKLIESTICFT